MKVIASLRRQFGGHAIKSVEPEPETATEGEAREAAQTSTS
jgi:hypothetical protein